jgi:hypothetical protein
MLFEVSEETDIQYTNYLSHTPFNTSFLGNAFIFSTGASGTKQWYVGCSTSVTDVYANRQKRPKFGSQLGTKSQFRGSPLRRPNSPVVRTSAHFLWTYLSSYL